MPMMGGGGGLNINRSVESAKVLVLCLLWVNLCLSPQTLFTVLLRGLSNFIVQPFPPAHGLRSFRHLLSLTLRFNKDRILCTWLYLTSDLACHPFVCPFLGPGLWLCVLRDAVSKPQHLGRLTMICVLCLGESGHECRTCPVSLIYCAHHRIRYLHRSVQSARVLVLCLLWVNIHHSLSTKHPTHHFHKLCVRLSPA